MPSKTMVIWASVFVVFSGLIFVSALLFVFPQGSIPAESRPPSPQVRGDKDEYARVTRVIDGDTIELADGRKVRYIGIDAPEKREGRLACYSLEATEYNKHLAEGAYVRLERDISETDRFGRLLRYVFVDDMMINYEMVERGYAKARAYPPDTKHARLLEEAQLRATIGNRGLWAACDVLEVM